ARRAAMLRDAAAEVRGLHARSLSAAGEIAASDQNGLKRLHRDWNELAQKAHELGRRLQRLEAPRAARAIEQAAAGGSAAARAAAAGKTGEANESAGEAIRRLTE